MSTRHLRPSGSYASGSKGPTLHGPASLDPVSRGAISNGIGQHHSSKAPEQGQPSKIINRKPFPCSFPDCHSGFNEKKVLDKHKDLEHDYCKVCDLDFEDDEEFHKHKMGSEKHITCPMCSQDFQSEGGRDRHFRQMHATQQNIKCRGCGEKFPRGGSLMMHLEGNKCPNNGFNNGILQSNRAMMEIHMLNLTNLMQEDPESGTLSLGASAAGDTAGGGVNLEEPYELLEEHGADGTNLMDSANPSLSAASDVISDDSDSTAAPSWPPRPSGLVSDCRILGPETKGKEPAETGRVIEGLENLTVNEPSWAKKLFAGAPNTPALPNWRRSTSQATEDASNLLSGRRNNFSTLDLKPDEVTNMYHCPFQNCPRRSRERNEMEAHVLSGYHKGEYTVCPGCLRKFKTASALTQHMESASERCSVRATKGFGNALTIVSGGYLGVTGMHADGTHRIEDPEVQYDDPTQW